MRTMKRIPLWVCLTAVALPSVALAQSAPSSTPADPWSTAPAESAVPEPPPASVPPPPPAASQAQSIPPPPTAQAPASAFDASDSFEDSVDSAFDQPGSVPAPTPVSEPATVAASDHPLAGRMAVVGLKLGGGFSRPFSGLGTAFVSELEAGYLALPELELYVSAQYAAPGLSDATSQPDMRLPGSSRVSYKLKQQQFILTMGGIYRFSVKSGRMQILPYVAFGPRMYMMKSRVEGNVAGEPLGDNSETMTQFGVYLAGGADLVLGPGAAFAELQIAYAGLDRYIMRSTNVGALNLALGYRVFL